MAEPNYIYRIKLNNTAEHEIDQCCWRRVMDSRKHIYDYERERPLLTIVQRNAEEFLKRVNRLHKLRSPRAWHKKNSTEFSIEVNRLLVNYLSAVRMFRDHCTFRLLQQYKAHSVPVKMFKQEWDRAQYGSFTFGFLWELRNYVQHYGMPLHVIHHQKTHKQGKRRTSVRHSIKVEYRPETLLSTYDRWGKVRMDLQVVEDRHCEIAPLIEETTVQLGAIRDSLDQAEKPYLFESSQCIINELGPEILNCTEVSAEQEWKDEEGSNHCYSVRLPIRFIRNMLIDEVS